jgi:Tol biopolymer transport system component
VTSHAHSTLPPAALLGIAVIALLVGVAQTPAGTTTRVSVSSTGQQADGSSQSPRISADGRYVAFLSSSCNLVPDDTNATFDVFVHDRTTGAITRVSVSSTGQEGNDKSWYASISADGHYVAFQSDATNLVPDDTNACTDIFAHDRLTGQTTRVSVSSTGQQANSYSWHASISADGRFVAFYGVATNLVAADTNNRGDVFVHDRLTGITTRVSADNDVDLDDLALFVPAFSAPGQPTSVFAADMDGDGDCDLADLARFAAAFTAPR